jgi:thymidylate kinase
MVSPINLLNNNKTRASKSMQIVELVGPAGAGKTTILEALSAESERVVKNEPPDVRDARNYPFYIWYCLRLVPIVFRLCNSNSRHITRREYAWMSLLDGWHNVLGNGCTSNHQVLVIDQGPIFFMATLYALGPENLKSRVVDAWWDKVFCNWSTALDLVVWLDASDESLMNRIQSRSKDHIMKHKSQSEVFQFLDLYRQVYHFMCQKLTIRQGGPKFIYFDTSKESVQNVVRKLMIELGLN